MGHLVHVTVFDDIDHLSKQLSGFVLGETSHLRQSFEELTPFAVTIMSKCLLQNYEDILVVLEGLIDFYDLWMVKGGEDNELLQEVCWVLDILLLDAFDGSDGVGVVLHLSLVDDTERPSADCLHCTWFTDSN